MTRYTARERRRDAALDALETFEATREDALTVACPRCLAEPGGRCVNPLTGDLLRGPAHPQRIAEFERGKEAAR